MLERQTVAISMVGGLDTKTDEKLVVPGKMLELENAEFTKPGRLSKRNGYTTLNKTLYDSVKTGYSGPIDAGSSIVKYDSETVILDGIRAYSHDDTANSWGQRGFSPSCKLLEKKVIQNEADKHNDPSVANGNGYTLYAWWKYKSYNRITFDYSTGIGLTQIDDTSGSTIFQNLEILPGGSRNLKMYPYVFFNNNKFYVFFYKSTISPAEAGLAYVSFTAGSFQTTLSETLIKTGLTPTAIEMIGNRFYITGYTSTDCRVLSWEDGTGIINDVQVATTADFFPYLGLSTNGTNQIVVHYHPYVAGVQDYLYYKVYDTSLNVTLAATQIKQLAVNSNNVAYSINYSGGTYYIFFKEANFLRIYSITSTGTVTSLYSIPALYIFPASRPMKYDGRIFILLFRLSETQGGYYLYDVLSKSSIGRFAYGESIDGSGVGGGNYPSINGTTYEFPITLSGGKEIIANDITTADPQQTMNAASIKVDMNKLIHRSSCSIGDGSYISGGMPWNYDGKTIIEQGFNYFPDHISAPTMASGGALGAGTYFYYFTYEWEDALGNRHVSAPSTPVEVTAALNQKATFTVPMQVLTYIRTAPDSSFVQSRDNIIIGIYRTTVNGTIPFRVYPSVLVNNPTLNTISIEDGVADSSITANEVLYTSGGELPNIPPPPCSIMLAAKNRVFLVDDENRLECWYSKEFSPGTGVGFNDALSVRLPSVGGDITALGELDDKIIFFKRDRIYAMSGNGPTSAGTLNTFSEPQFITADAGCVDPQSVVTIPNGIMFKSAKGIYLLDRSLVMSYIGSPVEAYNSYTITAAILVESKNQARFTTNSGITLVYDYFFNQWSKFTYGGVDAENINGTYTVLTSAGSVNKESTGYTDNGTAISLKGVTAWIKLHGIQGYQRVRRLSFLGNYSSAHTLSLYPAYDYASTYGSAINFTASTTQDPYQFIAHLPQQKCDAVRFKFLDTPSGGTGEGFGISDLSLEVGVKRGVKKQASTKQVG